MNASAGSDAPRFHLAPPPINVFEGACRGSVDPSRCIELPQRSFNVQIAPRHDPKTTKLHDLQSLPLTRLRSRDLRHQRKHDCRHRKRLSLAYSVNAK
jgi:hypothetical protein